MVVSKKIHCFVCNKKCSGNVLRFQDHYYHKQCFEAAQSENRARELRNSPDSRSGSISNTLEDSQSYNTSTSTLIKDSQRLDSNKSQLMNSSSQKQSHMSSSREMTTSTKVTSTSNGNFDMEVPSQLNQRASTLDSRERQINDRLPPTGSRAATLPQSASVPSNGFLPQTVNRSLTSCAGCKEKIRDGQALIALDLHWHVWCFKCDQCKVPLHGEYVAKDGRAYCEKDYQKLFGVVCVYCKRYITGKVLQAGEAHHFHPSCARCSKCGDPFIPGEEMYLQGEVTWHPRCGPGPENVLSQDEMMHKAYGKTQSRASRPDSPSMSSRSRSRSASPYSYMSRQYGRSSPAYADSEAVGDLSRIYTISYLNADPTQGYLRKPLEPYPPKSPQFSRPASSIRESSRSSSRSQYYGSHRDRSVPRGMYSVLSSMRSGTSSRARSPSMMNEEAIQMAQYPSGQKPSPDTIPKIERDDFPAPPFPYTRERPKILKDDADEVHVVEKQAPQQRASRPRSREVVIDDEESSSGDDPRFRKEEEELSKIASGIGKVFLQTLKERERLRAWKRANLDPRNASRTPSATRELPVRMRYDDPLNASPSRDMDRPKVWDEEDGEGNSPTRTRSSLGKPSPVSSSYGYKVVQANRSTPKPGYGVSAKPYESVQNFDTGSQRHVPNSDLSFLHHQRITQDRSTDLLSRAGNEQQTSDMPRTIHASPRMGGGGSSTLLGAHLRRSMPNVAIHQDKAAPKLYPYHLLATTNYRLPPDVDRCHLERHLSNEEFQYIFHCDRLDFYRLPEWKRNELKRRARLF